MKIFKWIIGIILVFILALFILVKVVSEDRPEINQSPEADQMAQKMLNTLGVSAWDSLPYLRWTFRGEHHYVWDKINNRAEIKWGDVRVILDLNTLDAQAWKNGTPVIDDELMTLKETAWNYWCNDSFWMFAPFKVFDPGTSRSVVESVEHGQYGLLVSYDSGGVTPGDAYLWHLDENYRPVGYKMWVKIIPVGGLYFTWEGWETLGNGFQLSTLHKSSMLSLKMENVAAGNDYNEIGLDQDPFNS